MNYIFLNKEDKFQYAFPLKKLEYYRLKNFLTNQEMAEKIGISSRNYSKITSVKYNPKYNIHVKTAKAIYEFIKKEGIDYDN
tara:strand:+ start:141 stop:386 length:246 start_codon:yes stop_codon:yes gene_type:complete